MKRGNTSNTKLFIGGITLISSVLSLYLINQFIRHSHFSEYSANQDTKRMEKLCPKLNSPTEKIKANSNPETGISKSADLGEGLSSGSGAGLTENPTNTIESNDFKKEIFKSKDLVEKKEEKILEDTDPELQEFLNSESNNNESKYNLLDFLEENQEILDTFDSVNDNLDKAVEIIKSLIGGGSGSINFAENIFQLISEYREYLSTLDSCHLLALSNVLVAITILIALYNICVIFLGDFLIKNFKLEEKYPSFANFIQLRRKFQEYYFLINVFVIILLLVLAIIANFLMFIS